MIYDIIYMAHALNVSKRNIIVLGENHTEQHITNAKLMQITSRFENEALFTEHTTVQIMKTDKGDKQTIPIPPSPSLIEGIFQIFTFFVSLKISGNTRIPMYGGLYASQCIFALCNKFIGQDFVSEDMITHDTVASFNKIKDILIKLCEMQGERGRTIIQELDHITYHTIGNDIVDNVAFKESYKLVDDAIIFNINKMHSELPMNVVFIIIVGETHVDNIVQELMSFGEYKVLYKYDYH